MGGETVRRKLKYGANYNHPCASQRLHRMEAAIRLSMGVPTSEAENLGLPASLCGDKFLNSFAVFHFASVDISFGVYSNAVNKMELTRVTPVASEGAHQSAVVAIKDPDHIVRAVGNKDVLLLRVRGKSQIECGPARGISHAPGASAVWAAGLR